MKTRVLFISLVLGLLIACNYKTQKVEQRSAGNPNEDEIINLVFDATVGHDTLWSKHLLIPHNFLPPLPPGGHLTKKDKIQFETYSKSIDSFKIKLNTAQLYVFINDSLIKFPKDRNRIKSMTEPGSFKINFPQIDTTFRPLLIKLINSTVSRAFDISKLKSRYNYKVDYISNNDKYPSSIIKIGRIKISRSAFNNDSTMACIYTEIICGGECGGGSIIFLKKVNGHWEIKGEKELWVS